MPPSVPTGTEEELGRDDYLQVLSPHSLLHSSYPDFASLQCPHVSTCACSCAKTNTKTKTKTKVLVGSGAFLT